MSFRLPDVMLDGGLFTYEGGIPVFIDDKGTRHFGIGKTQEQLLLLGMQQQRALDAQTVEAKDREISALRAEVARSHEVAQSNFALGQKLQKAQDRATVRAVQMGAYSKGREDQKREDQGIAELAFHSGVLRQQEESRMEVSSLRRESLMLRKKVAFLSGQLAAAQRVSALNLIPGSGRRVFSSTSATSSSSPSPSSPVILPPSDLEKDDVSALPQPSMSPVPSTIDTREGMPEVRSGSSDQKRKIPRDVTEDSQSQAASSEAPSIKPESLSSADRLKWVCEKLKSEPKFKVPDCFTTDMTNALIDFCTDYKKGYPRINELMEALYDLPPTVNLNRTLQFKAPKREAVLLTAMRKALAERGECPTFRVFLGRLVSNLEGRSNRNLRAFFNKEMDALFENVEDCLAEGEYDLASKKIAQAIAAHRKGNDASSIISDLIALASRQESAYLARDRMLELLKKDSDLFPALKDVFNNIVDKYQSDSSRDILELYDKLQATPVSNELVIDSLGVELAKSCRQRPLSEKYLTVELLKFWFENHADENCFAAIWTCLPECSWKKPGVLKACVEGVIRIYRDEHIPDKISDEQRIPVLMHLCKGWSEHAKRDQLPAVGIPIMVWWRDVRNAATPEDRKTFVSHLMRIVGSYRAYPNQYLTYLRTLTNEWSENGKVWDTPPDDLLRLFVEISVVSIGKEQQVRDQFASIAMNFWRRIDFDHPDFQKLLLSSNAQRFCDRFVQILKDTELEAQSLQVKKMYTYEAMMANFNKGCLIAAGCFHPGLPDTFWKQVKQSMIEHLKGKPIGGSQQLFYAQFMAHGRLLVIQQLMKTLEPVDQKRQRQIEKGTDAFLTGFENAFSEDLEIQQVLRDAFLLITRPEQHLDQMIASCKDKIKHELPPTFWDESRQDLVKELGSIPCMADYSLCYAQFISKARVTVMQRLAEALHPVDEGAYMEIVEGTQVFSTSFEEDYDDDETLNAQRVEYFAIQARCALNGSMEAWQDFSRDTLDLFLEEFLNRSCFSVEELKRMAVACARYGDDYAESITVPKIAAHICSQDQLLHAQKASHLIDIAMGYINGNKQEQVVFLLADTNKHLTKSQLTGLVKLINREVLEDSEALDEYDKLEELTH